MRGFLIVLKFLEVYMLTKAPKGTRDILPADSYKWQYIENLMSNTAELFGYKEIRTPVFEHTELFQRGVGDTTDIVQKEMYTFLDKGDRSITLRPEGTAGVVRSYIEHGMSSLPQPVKVYYNITAYRYENVQKGRYREFHQFGVEAFGAKGPQIDAEIISMLSLIFEKLGLKQIRLNINSIGCPVCRKEYNQKLKEFLKPNIEKFCATCRDRYERNPLRIIDCKEEKCKEYTKDVPYLIDNLCDECRSHFEGLKRELSVLGIPYTVDNRIVRGLDYYTKTVFEFVSDSIGAQGTVCGGGRYDGLVEECGGKPTPGIGFALGIERLLLQIESEGIELPKRQKTSVFIASIGQTADEYAAKIVFELRKANIFAEKDTAGRSLKAQMKYADKMGADYVIVLGDDEIANKSAIIKNMKTGEQSTINISDIKEITSYFI